MPARRASQADCVQGQRRWLARLRCPNVYQSTGFSTIVAVTDFQSKPAGRAGELDSPTSCSTRLTVLGETVTPPMSFSVRGFDIRPVLHPPPARFSSAVPESVGGCQTPTGSAEGKKDRWQQQQSATASVNGTSPSMDVTSRVCSLSSPRVLLNEIRAFTSIDIFKRPAVAPSWPSFFCRCRVFCVLLQTRPRRRRTSV